MESLRLCLISTRARFATFIQNQLKIYKNKTPAQAFTLTFAVGKTIDNGGGMDWNAGVTGDSPPPGDSPPLSKGGRYS